MMRDFWDTLYIYILRSILSIGIFPHFSLNNYLKRTLFENEYSHYSDCCIFDLLTTRFFSFQEQFFKDQIRRSGIQVYMHRYHKILVRATEYHVADKIWPADRQFETPVLLITCSLGL